MVFDNFPHHDYTFWHSYITFKPIGKHIDMTSVFVLGSYTYIYIYIFVQYPMPRSG